MAGGIFLCYRRRDDGYATGRLYDRLLEAFPSEQLFMDVDSVPLGDDFVRLVDEKLTQCDVLLAVIGRDWVNIQDENGRRRLENPDDYVRIEIESALKQNKRVIPVLVHDARVPRSDELPDAIRPLTRRQAIPVTAERFRADTERLVKALRLALEEASARRQVQAKEEELQRQEEAKRKAELSLEREHIAKKEELANWDFIKESSRPQDFRDHLGRFPSGVCAHMARHKLGALALAELGEAADQEAVESTVQEPADAEYSAEPKTRPEVLNEENKPAVEEALPAGPQVPRAAKLRRPSWPVLSVASILVVATAGIWPATKYQLLTWPQLPPVRVESREQVDTKQEERVALKDVATQAPRVVLPAPVAPAPSSSAPESDFQRRVRSLERAFQEPPSTAPAGVKTEPASVLNPAPVASGGFLVQLMSLKNEAEASAAFRSLQDKFPNELGGRQLILRRADLGPKGVFYRGMVGPFASAEEANQFCASYKAVGSHCVVPNN